MSLGEDVKLSIVIPVHDEEGNLAALHEALKAVAPRLPSAHEIVLVDDGSRDGSQVLLRRMAESDPRVVVVELARNYGQTAALSAGIDHARGAIVVTMDADLQNDPADIPMLLERLEQGADVVSGWRRRREDTYVTRILPSLLANALISRITGVRLHDFGCTLKAYRRHLFDSFRLYGDMHRFVPVYAAWAGGRIVEVEVDHHPRKAGKSKYGLGRTWRVLLDLTTISFLTSFATRPLHLFGGVGIVSCLAGIVAGAIALLQRIFEGAYVHRNPMILLAVFLFLLGVQSLMMGLLAEIGTRTWHEVRGGRAYVVRRVLGRPERAAAGGADPLAEGV